MRIGPLWGQGTRREGGMVSLVGFVLNVCLVFIIVP